MSEKTVQRLKILLILGSVLAAVKIIFVDYSMDEEYQIVMAYRRLSGDTLFGTMWEPHQTSAFVCTWLMGLYRAVTGGTAGVVLFLRFVTLGIQLLLTFWLTGVFRRFMERDYAFLLGCCYFNLVPKIIQIPDFSNLQLWFFTITVLSFLQYYDLPAAEGGRKLLRKGWLLLAGIGMALEVLAYPSSIVLFPFFLIVVFYRSGKRAGKNGGHALWGALADGALFAAVCGICALIWLLSLLSHITLQEFLRNAGYILNYDLTHDLSLGAESRTGVLLRDGKIMILHLMISAGVGGAVLGLVQCILRRGRNKMGPGISRPVFAVFMLLGAGLGQLYYWVILRTGYEAPQIHLFVLFIIAAFVWTSADGRKYAFGTGIVGGVLAILATIYMSDLGIYYSVSHGLLGSVFALALLVCALESKMKNKSRTLIYLLLFGMAFFTAFGKGFTLRAGRANTVLEVRGIIKEGPAAGIFTNYLQAHIANLTYEDFQQEVHDGENCLIVANIPAASGTSPYLFRNLSVSHFSIVDPTSYDERLLTYWELYPDKRPDVIIVECWYGQLMEQPDSWIMQYIENDFGYTEVTDGRYVRFYRRGAA